MVEGSGEGHTRNTAGMGRVQAQVLTAGSGKCLVTVPDSL